jgi:ATP-dependent protease HslVU (ClpYQ) peptidase subunit
MTVVVGYREKNTVWIGADACAGWREYELRGASTIKKVFVREVPNNANEVVTRLAFNIAFGVTGSWRLNQLLSQTLKIPSDPCADPIEYLFGPFVDTVREHLMGAGFAKKKDEVETGGLFMVGYKGRLVTVESDYHVQEFEKPYRAIGSGWELALGSLATLEEVAPGIAVEQRIGIALRAATEHNPWVQPPFTIVSV